MSLEGDGNALAFVARDGVTVCFGSEVQQGGDDVADLHHRYRVRGNGVQRDRLGEKTDRIADPIVFGAYEDGS